MSKSKHPIYRQAQRVSLRSDGNMGLWFQKWITHWTQDSEKIGRSRKKIG